MSVLEVLVAAVLALGLMTLAYSLLLPIMQTQYRYSVRIGLEEELMVAMRKINDDLQLCTPAGVGLYNPDAPGTPPRMLSCNPLTDYKANPPTANRLGTGQVFSVNLNIYYWLPLQKRLLRHRFPVNTIYAPFAAMGGGALPQSHAVRPEDSGWGVFLAYFESNYSKDRLIAQDVVDFSVSSASTQGLQFPLTLHIKCSRPGPGSQMINYEVKQDLTLIHAR